jgi:hypothetical protein
VRCSQLSTPSSAGAAKRFHIEIKRIERLTFFRWRGKETPSSMKIAVTEEKESLLNIADADSDVMFASERKPLSLKEYRGSHEEKS